MPQQTSVQLSANADGTYALQIGPNGFAGPQSDFFGGAFDPAQMATALRLTFLIGNYGQLDSTEYLNAVTRNNNGVRLRDQDYFISSIVLQDAASQMYTISFATSRTGLAQNTITMSLADARNDLQDVSVILDSIASYLRIAGFTALTPAAVAAVNAQKFWY